MLKTSFKHTTSRRILLLALIFFFSIGHAQAEIIFRSIEAVGPASKNIKDLEYDICYKGKSSVFVDMKKAPLFAIRNSEISNMSLSYGTCTDTLDVELRIDLKEKVRNRFNEFTRRFLDRRVALFLDGNIVSASTIFKPLRQSIAFGCLSYEKAVALIINGGFVPNYGETCVGGKTAMLDLTRRYRFKEPYARKEHFYPTTVEDSEYWYLKKETPIYDKPNGNIIGSIPAGEIIEQYFNSKRGEFERESQWMKVYYWGIGWIEPDDSAIPLFSILNTNLFLQKFFVFDEYRYDEFVKDKKVYSDYLVRKATTVRKMYLREALHRFENPNEFRRWYFDTFRKPFEY